MWIIWNVFKPYRMRKTFIFLLTFILLLIFISSPQIFHKNSGQSTSVGNFNKGSLKKGYLLPFQGANFKCYSIISYYLLGREYVNSKVYKTVVDTYDALNEKHPEKKYIYMESGKRKGARLYPHRTHQNGLSIDFMCPLLKNSNDPKYFNCMGIFRYALNFDDKGVLNSDHNVKIDFNAIAEHIIVLESNAHKNGLKIKKVIFKISLKDELFATDYGKKLKVTNIYFAQRLTPLLNKLHDDHYHVDFEPINH